MTDRIRRVNLDHLARRLRDVLAPALVRDIVADIEAHPEGHVEDSRADDEARKLAAMDFGR